MLLVFLFSKGEVEAIIFSTFLWLYMYELLLCTHILCAYLHHLYLFCLRITYVVMWIPLKICRLHIFKIHSNLISLFINIHIIHMHRTHNTKNGDGLYAEKENHILQRKNALKLHVYDIHSVYLCNFVDGWWSESRIEPRAEWRKWEKKYERS